MIIRIAMKKMGDAESRASFAKTNVRAMIK